MFYCNICFTLLVNSDSLCFMNMTFFYILKYILCKNPICNAIVACYKVDRKCKVMKFYLLPQVEFLPTFQWVSRYDNYLNVIITFATEKLETLRAYL